MACTDQRFCPGRDERDAVLICLYLFGNADFHCSKVVVRTSSPAAGGGSAFEVYGLAFELQQQIPRFARNDKGSNSRGHGGSKTYSGLQANWRRTETDYGHPFRREVLASDLEHLVRCYRIHQRQQVIERAIWLSVQLDGGSAVHAGR